MSDTDTGSEVFFGLFDSEEALPAPEPKAPESHLRNVADIVDEIKLPSLV
jgi:hypothetical protein